MLRVWDICAGSSLRAERWSPRTSRRPKARIHEWTNTEQPVHEDGDGGTWRNTKSEISEKFVDQKFIRPYERKFSRIMELTNKDFKSWNLILTSSLLHKHFACWKIRFKTEVCSCSNFHTEAMLWIKEVEVATSVDDFKKFCDPFRELLLFLMLNYWTREVHAWTRSSKISSLRRRSVWRNGRLRKQTDSFAEDRSLTWSTTTSWSLSSMVLYSILPTCSLLFFGMTSFRNSIQDGTKFYYLWNNSHLMIFWKICSHSKHESLRNWWPH